MLVAGTVLLAVVLAVAAAESAGWPVLVGPLQQFMSRQLERPLRLLADGDDAPVRIQLFGGLRVQAGRIELDAPAWRPGPPTLQADRATLRLRYLDLWRASRGETLRVQALTAERLRLDLHRLADGRASWQFGTARKVNAAPVELPLVELLHVGRGELALDDAISRSALRIGFSLTEDTGGTPATGPDAPPSGLEARISGRYRQLPVALRLRSPGLLPWIAHDASAEPLPLLVSGELGRARGRFEGRVRDLARLGGLGGRFSLSGPSLAAVGDVVGVTLPTTGAFTSRGVLFKRAGLWGVRIDEAIIGGSRLSAALRYDTARATPLLVGRVGGPRLLLADLGPVVGTAPPEPGPATASQAARPGRVLPARDFDLPSLRGMDANVLLDFAELDLDSARLQPLKPLRAHLQLQDGVLEIGAIDARTAEGRLRGEISLDGRGKLARWQTDLRWSQIRLERWVQLARAPDQPAWITGRLGGRARLSGQGRSTADILGSIDGELRAQLHGGSISHLLVEAAGLDLAQGLGLLITGDDALPMGCALADLRVERGVIRPRVMVLDTPDSVVMLEGSVSLADERIALRAVVSPKDFSPLALRTPLRVGGSLGAPEVGIEPGPLAGKLLASGLLALLNPLAALLPLLDLGGADGTEAAEPGCKALLARMKQVSAAAPAPTPANR